MQTAFHIVLVHPVIPQNTGAIARLCACTGATLHLIHPLGFQTDAAAVKRAGLDYWDHVAIQEHATWQEFLEKERPEKMILLSRFAKRSVYTADFAPPTYLVLGSETAGLPDSIKDAHAEALYLVPIRTDLVRSLNLAQCAAVVLFEAMRVTQNLPR